MNRRDGEIQVHLFDHAVLFTKLVKTKHIEQYKVYRRVSPLFRQTYYPSFILRSVF